MQEAGNGFGSVSNAQRVLGNLPFRAHHWIPPSSRNQPSPLLCPLPAGARVHPSMPFEPAVAQQLPRAAGRPPLICASAAATCASAAGRHGLHGARRCLAAAAACTDLAARAELIASARLHSRDSNSCCSWS